MSQAACNPPAYQGIILEQNQTELHSHFELEERGVAECKGLGQVKTFFLKGRGRADDLEVKSKT